MCTIFNSISLFLEQARSANVNIKETLETETYSFAGHFTFHFMRRVCIYSHAYLTGGR